MKGKIVTDAASLLHVIGLVAALGSVLTFIVMNVAVGSSTNAVLIYHERMFVSAISRALTIPGVCVLMAAGIWAAAAGERRILDDGWRLGMLVLEMLILLNTLFFIAPLVREVTALAKLGAEHGHVLDAYGPRKALEDRHGAANFLMLLAAAFLAVRLH